MLDEAYLNEASIESAIAEREKVWREFMNDLGGESESIYYGMRLAWLKSIIEYHSFMFECHGGC